MLLAVNIGNTNIVAGVFAGDSLVSHWRIATDTRRMPDEYVVLLDAFFRGSIPVEDIEGAVVCSVVPGVQAKVATAVRTLCNLEPLQVSSGLDLGIDVRYDPPDAVGPDRLANAVAANAMFGRPAIVVDFGTATNFDAVSRDGAFVGGAIAPGVKISQEALFSRTARLPRVAVEAPPHAIGGSTVEAIQSGLVYGYGGLVDNLVDRFQIELGGEAAVIGTGGLVHWIAPYSRTIQSVMPDLTLMGLLHIYARNLSHVDSLRSRQD
jgi:type III pantothenate kinase